MDQQSQSLIDADFYGYLPSKSAALFGIIYFGVSTTICLLQIVFGPYKHYWILTLALAASGEAIGWGARLWAHNSPSDWMPFMIQICSLMISPVFISAAQYVLFCKIVEKAGRRLFSIPSKSLWIGFVIIDVISLSIQTVGGVEVSSAQDLDDLNHGSDVMRSGIIFQFSNTVLFTVLLLGAAASLKRRNIPLSSVARWPIIVALCLSTLMILIRNAYRILELGGGWNGHLMRTEIYLIGYDMVPIALAVGICVIFSPNFFLSPIEKEVALSLSTWRGLTQDSESSCFN
ncbi:RTA-like protein [Penicillium occitanis (nom. inval.)]|nr:RTA-like protein [Penicillium occitanis (nom. inval.)]PCH07041.1 hypothetical protein PENOC_020590 [Penicillium occitanis (nom. inval.)]